MPKVRFSAPARNFLRLGSVHLKPETEPANVRVGNCCIGLNPLGIIACTDVGLPSVLTVDWGSTGVVVRAAESVTIVTSVPGFASGPAGDQTGIYSITPPPTFQGSHLIESLSNCSWERSLTNIVPEQYGSNEQLIAGTTGDPFSHVYSPPHTAPLSVTGLSTSQTMKFAMSLVNYGSGLYGLTGTLTHVGTASYDGFFIVNDDRFAADGGNFITTINAAPAASRPWHDWWRNASTSSWLYAQPVINGNNGANGRRDEIRSKAGAYTYQSVAPIARSLADWAVVVADRSIQLELTGSPSAGREGFITSVPSTINLNW